MKGLHIIADLHGCANEPVSLRDCDHISTLCLAACRHAALTVVAKAFHQFEGGGTTGAVILAESHLAIHTWPELQTVTLDLYVCNFSRNNRHSAEQAYEYLVSRFKPDRIEVRRLERGDISTKHHAR